MSIWATIKDDEKYEVDVSISCSGNIFTIDQPPEKPHDISDEEYKNSIVFINWKKSITRLMIVGMN
ncbi:hypothetical protein [Paenibacillus larvae]|nr:hypothetical protein [Paenibacillus larvae]MDT2192227.1 hypothetical protein [Paenibacillus larvae]